MQISFFEEFPNKENLDKLKLVKFPTKVYLAATSLDEFSKIKKEVKNKNIKEFVYWSILKKKEGYWISPFSKRKALLKIFKELKGKKIAVMLDLELPTTKNPWLYFTQAINCFRNKKLIRKFIANYKGKIYLAEYYPEGKIKEKLMAFLGLHYYNKKVRVIKMLYHSLHSFSEEFVKKELQKGIKEYGSKYLIALGTIATGINGDELLLSEKQLEQDLQLAKKEGVKEVIIFRLGGLNKKYLQVLKKFS